MADACGTRVRTRVASLWLCAGFLAAGWSGAPLAAQDPQPAAQDGASLTLHVYTNLIQTPVLVLGPKREHLVDPIAPSRFSVSIDSGPWFPAAHVRQEGDDPISLSILLDVSGGSELMPNVDQLIANLAPQSLHPQDHVSINALDCGLVHSTNDLPADAESLKRGVDTALAGWKMRSAAHAKCEHKFYLRDALMSMVSAFDGLPGRRVILAITDAEDTSSKLKWRDVGGAAQAAGIAIFGITPQLVGSELEFDSLCRLSGGIAITADTPHVANALARFTTMVRERYIVDFPRPLNSTAGRHLIDVRVGKSMDVALPGGVSFPIADPADAATVPSDSTHAPVQGNRRVLPQIP
jgi:hypothetical protein